MAIASALFCCAFVLAAAFAPYVAPANPFDLGRLSLAESNLPPGWLAGGTFKYPLGTDTQGADVLSSILFGARVSLVVGFGSVLLSLLIGVPLGLFSGYLGGRIDSLIMRIADIQLTFPAILIALLIGGIAQATVPQGARAALAVPVLIAAIGLSNWVQYARTVRASTLVERGKDYVLAARIIGRRTPAIVFGHVLPNVIGPVLVIATINLAFAIITEATLSFLGVGMSATRPSLGTLIRQGNDYLFSGEWWVVVFPSVALVLLALSVNLLGDWLRETLDPKLR
jgi:peptide/nickel transport system permease protein